MWKRRRSLSVSHSACSLAEAQADPVGVQGRAALVCLAAAFVAARLVQTGKTDLSHAQSFSVVLSIFFLETYYHSLTLLSLCVYIIITLFVFFRTS